MKHAFSIAAVVTWIVMAALLVHKQTPPPAIDRHLQRGGTVLFAYSGQRYDGSEAAGPGAPGRNAVSTDEWFGVYQGEHKIGHTHRVATRSATGWAFRDESSFAIDVSPTPVLSKRGSTAAAPSCSSSPA